MRVVASLSGSPAGTCRNLDTKAIAVAPVDLTSFLNEMDAKLRTGTIASVRFSNFTPCDSPVTFSSTPAQIKEVGPGDSFEINPEFDSFIVNSPERAFPPTYEFLEVVGTGGMGVVYKARHKMLNKMFAIKMLHQQFASEIALQRFFFEGKATSLLSDPGIVQVHHLDVTSCGQPYMVMDYVEGETLADVIREAGALSVERTLSIAIQICMTMSHAHNRSILHRDIKPSNIMLVQNESGGEEIRILDFGIAKMLDHCEPGVQQLTKTGDAMGSPTYMSPEQARGSRLDQRADIYSLGCSMYEALTGAPPFVGCTAFETIAMHLHKMPEPISRKEVPAELERIIMRTLSKDPELRYESMPQLRHDLEQCQSKRLHMRRWRVSREQKPMLAKVAAWFIVLCSILTAGAAGAMNLQHQPDKADVATKPAGRYRLDPFLCLPNLDRTGADVVRFWVAKQRTQHWRELNLSSAVMASEAGSESLAPLAYAGKELVKLDLGGRDSQITDCGLRYLAHLNLQELVLQCSLVANLRALADMHSLTYLQLEKTCVNAEGLEVISRLPNICWLDLSYTTTFSGADIRVLHKCKQLRSIDLRGCKVETADLLALQKWLPNCRIYCKPAMDESFIYFFPEIFQALALESHDYSAADKSWKAATASALARYSRSKKFPQAVTCCLVQHADLLARMKKQTAAIQLLAQASDFAREFDVVTRADILNAEANVYETSKSNADALAAIRIRDRVQELLEKGSPTEGSSKNVEVKIALNARDRAYDYARVKDFEQTDKGITFAVVKLREIGELNQAAQTNFNFSEFCQNAHRPLQADLARREAANDRAAARANGRTVSNVSV
jgi:serine/threonine protein kinase